MKTKLDYNNKALLYAEKYGILDYEVSNNGNIIYYANYPKYLNNKRYTIKVTYNFNTEIETRKGLKHWSNKGNNNLHK